MARIAETGLVVAEQPPGVEPQARHFPRRNRIIAGLAAGTVVVEGAPKSGSLITARIAAELGREVMAVPGSPLDPRAGGCNQLIREGATLVRDAADVLEALSTLSGEARVPFALAEPAAPLPLTTPETARTTVLALLSPTPVPVDDLVRQTACPPRRWRACCWTWNWRGRSCATRERGWRWVECSGVRIPAWLSLSDSSCARHAGFYCPSFPCDPAPLDASSHRTPPSRVYVRE
jgi:predicted Rossmann fold nucleotide-binding protein DprA/Smf involved in DNA uptake